MPGHFSYLRPVAAKYPSCILILVTLFNDLALLFGGLFGGGGLLASSLLGGRLTSSLVGRRLVGLAICLGLNKTLSIPECSVRYIYIYIYSLPEQLRLPASTPF